MGDLAAFAEAFHSGGTAVSLRVRYNNFSAGQNPWVNVQAPVGLNLISVMLEASIALTATAAEGVTAGTDILDEWVSQIEVAPAAATGAKIFLKTRKGAEEFERLVLDTFQGYSAGAVGPLTTHIGSYARSTAAAFSGAGARTDTSELWLPIGGAAASIRLTIPPIVGVFAASVSATYTIGFFEVYSVYSGTVAAFENKTSVLAAGNNQDMMALNVFPAALAADMVSIVGETTADITAIYMIDQAGAYAINCDDTQSINAVQYVYPRSASTAPTYSSLVFTLNKTVPTSFRVSLANSVALDFLWIEVVGPDIAPANTPAATALPSAASNANTGTRSPSAGPTGSPAATSGRGGSTGYVAPNAGTGGGRVGGGQNLARILGRNRAP